MNGRDLSILAMAAAVVTLGYFGATGLIPDAECDFGLRSTGSGPCEFARHPEVAADVAEETCLPGTNVYRYVEQPVKLDAGYDGGSIWPSGFFAVPGSTQEVSCDELRRPTKAFTVVVPGPGDCIIGHWLHTPTGETWDGRWETSKRCGPEYEPNGPVIYDVPVVNLGDDPTRRMACAVADAGCLPTEVVP